MEKTAYELISTIDESLWRKGLAGLLEERSEQAVIALIGVMNDRIWRKREAVANVLISLGQEIIPTLIRQLDPRNLDAFYWSLYILGHSNDPQSDRIILSYLPHSDPEIRGYVVRALSINPSPEKARTLFHVLNDSNWSVRKLVFSKLLFFGLPILGDIKALVFNGKEEPSHPVIALYIKIGGDEILGDLKPLFQKGTFSFRYSVISALSEGESNSSIDFLISALSDESWIIRKKAAEFLTQLGPKVFDRLSVWFGRGDAIMKNQIVGIIVELLNERALPIIRRLLSSNDLEMRILAVENLAKIPGDEASRQLLKCLGDPMRIVSDYASDCLAKKSKLNIELLLENLQSEDENIRFLVIKTIGSIGGIALNPIIKILHEGNKQERLFLLGVLQRINPNEKLIESIISLLEDENWPIRNAAAGCLKSYGEKSVEAVVRVLNSPSEDIQFWSKRILLNMGVAAIHSLTHVLNEGTNVSLIPHILAALLAMDHGDAVPAVISFIQRTDDAQIKAVFEGISEISSREVVDTILNLLTHPEDRVVGWLAFLLRKVRNPNLRKVVLLGLNHPEERSRFFVLEAIGAWENLSENELRVIVGQVPVERSIKNVKAVVEILANFSTPLVIETLKDYLKLCDPNFMLDLMLILAEKKKLPFETMLADILRTRSEVIRIEDVERVGKILGLIFKSKPEGILQGLSSTNIAFRLCCVVALDQIREKRAAFALMDNLNVRDDPMIVKRAVKILVGYLFSEDFRLRGAVTDYLLGLGPIIQEPINDILPGMENDIDRKALVDLVESVGGTISPEALRKKGEKKVILSDSRLDDVLERRKRAMEELQKYDLIIRASHTQDLTIMFTDVKGYTSFSSKASLSEVMGMLKQHDDILIPILEKHTGKILKKIGDAFLVIFEHATKALLASIEIQRKLQEYNKTVTEERRLAVRVAINTGSVVRRENDVFGDAVNVAARLEGVADAEEIIISAATFEKIDQQIFELSDYGEHKLKGIELPVRTFKVKW